MIKVFFASLAMFIALDTVWLGFIMKDNNMKWLASIGRINDGSFDLLYGPAIVCYLLMAASVVLFGAPRAAAANSGLEAFGWGAALGFLIYGIYDMTNMATLRDYPLAFAACDMSWGAVQYGLVTWVTGWMMAKS